MTSSTTASGRKLSHEDALAQWREYRATGDVRLRNRLVMSYMPLVRYLVYKKVRGLPSTLEVDDFVSCGLEALIASIDRYDPDKGATLEQFVWTRVQGAILDELRRQDWAPRSLRRFERDSAQAREKFIREFGRRPTDDELAALLGMTAGELRARRDELQVADVGSLNTQVRSADETALERLDTIASEDERLDPETAATLQQAKERFRSAFRTLPAREREVATLLYVKNLTLREIGDILEVSESRVCQIHAHLKRRLKSQLAADAALFSSVA